MDGDNQTNDINGVSSDGYYIINTNLNDGKRTVDAAEEPIEAGFETQKDIIITVKEYEHNVDLWSKSGPYYIQWWDDCGASSGRIQMTSTTCTKVTPNEYFHSWEITIARPINIVIFNDVSSNTWEHQTVDILNITESSCYEISHDYYAYKHLVSPLDCVTIPCPQTGVGISNTNNEEIEVYPNPVSDMLYIKGISANQAVTLSDLTGKILLTHTGASLNISTLPQGIYMLKVGYKAVKVVKQ
jgi:hypothetical protein